MKLPSPGARLAALWLPAVLAWSCIVQATSVQAMGLVELAASDSHPPVTVFFPSEAPEAPVQRGDFQFSAAANGPARPGNGRLVVFSHGTGGAPWTLTDLAREMVDAGFVVAAPLHEGDNWQDTRNFGPVSVQLRPLEVSQTMDAVSQHPMFGPLIDARRVGVWGPSGGGQTALILAGGRWSPAALAAHCEAHLLDDAAACTGGSVQFSGGPFDSAKRWVTLAILRARLRDPGWISHTDPRIQAIAVGAPFVAGFDLARLADSSLPVGVVQAEQDRWLVPRFHSAALLTACSRCELIASLPNAGHGVVHSPLPPRLPGWLVPLIGDPPGFDRPAEVATLNRAVVGFMRRHLLP